MGNRHSCVLFFVLLGACVPSVSLHIPYNEAEPGLGDTWFRPADQMEMVYVPSGGFEMGSDTEMFKFARQLCKSYSGDLALATCGVAAFTNEQPAHSVQLSAFWIDRYEVSNAQYRMCVDAGLCDPPVESGSFTRGNYFTDPAYDEYPVINVNWYMAATYCDWAGARLPSEAEWEFSARSPDSFIFPWGNEFDASKLNYCDVNCKGLSDDSYDDGYADTAPVGSFPQGRSWVGAMDMAGNVREWVFDWFAFYPSERVVDPAGPEQGVSKIPRGGSWYDRPDDVRSANRGENLPDYYRHKVGFRCARDDW